MSVLKNMMIEITNRCNQQCPICEASVAKREKVTMDADFGSRIIDALVDDGIETISITGGEPTVCWEELVALLKHCRKRHVPTRLYTNGTKLNHGRIETLESCLNDAVVSLDSMNPEIVGAIRGTDKNLSKCVDNIRLLAESRIRVIVISVCSLVNYRELPGLSSELEKYDIAGWWIQQFIPKGLGRENIERFGISDELFDETVNRSRADSHLKIRSFAVISSETKRIFVDCNGQFVDYETAALLGPVLDDGIRHELL
ncbi:MAG: radical SAM protein, partial [Thermoplasmata archaeon]|nr:radical SAM protein [Thermoplasmata archaeon]